MFPLALSVLILLLTVTPAEAIACKASGTTWRLIAGKRCWYTGPRVAKERLSWVAPAPHTGNKSTTQSTKNIPKIIPEPRATALPPPPTGVAEAMLAFDSLRDGPQISAPKLTRVETPPPAKAPAATAKQAGDMIIGLTIFVSVIGAILVFALLMLWIGLWLEERTRRRLDLREALKTLTTPPPMSSANVVRLKDWRYADRVRADA